MTSRVHRIDGYQFRRTDVLLVDANIWYFIYGPQRSSHPDRNVRAYSGALRRMLEAKSAVYIDVLVMSEFINRYSRFRHARAIKAGAASKDYKVYRQSRAYEPVAGEIAQACRGIMRHCRPIDSGFHSVDMDALLLDYETKSVDFNDQMLAEICKANGMTLVTHDSDFGDFDVPILTANRRLIAG